MSRICLYYRTEPERDRWLPGDRLVRPLIRRILRGKPRLGGVEKVFSNLCLGLDRLGIPYQINLPFRQLRADDQVGVLGRGRYALEGYDRPNPIVAGIGLMTHPSEWPTLCQDYPVVKYLQHSPWAVEVYRPYYGDRVAMWPVGIDTQAWAPSSAEEKRYDFLIYDKIYWDRETSGKELLQTVRDELNRRRFNYTELQYGSYREAQFKELLNKSRAMIFLSGHESQGIAYQECLASDVPILAWDQGRCMDPNRFKWGQPEIPASSVPFFDDRCGMKFKEAREFPETLGQFMHRLKAGVFKPREFILENLTLKKCSRNFISILNEAT